MVDYYPVLARAIANLPAGDEPARLAVYARARSVLIKHLRDRGDGDRTPEALAERTAFETAVRRLEAESSQATNGTEPPPAPPAKARTKATAKQLTRLLEALQPEKPLDVAPTAAAPPPASPAAETSTAQLQPNDTVSRAHVDTDDLGRLPRFLGAMLFRIAYGAAALAFTGVVYLRGLVWVSQGVAGHSLLVAITLFVFCLFIVPPLAIARSASA